MPRGLRRLCLYVGVVVAGAAPVARAANDGGQTCQERLGQMEAQLEKARQAKHGWILIWPQLEGFSVPVVASSRPLDWRGIVAHIGRESLWLDGRPIPGADRAARLQALALEIEKTWGNYHLLYPKGPPPRRRIYALFDEGLTMKEAVEAMSAIGRKDRVVPLAVREATGPIASAQETRDRLLSVSAEMDKAKSASYPFALEYAMRNCEGPLWPSGEGPRDARSEDARRLAGHKHVRKLLAACNCQGVNVEAVENLLLRDAGALEWTLERVPVELMATGGNPVVAPGDTSAMSVLATYAAKRTSARPPLTLRVREVHAR